MMGKGMAAFEPERPRDFTIGRLSPDRAPLAQGQERPRRASAPRR